MVINNESNRKSGGKLIEELKNILMKMCVQN